VQPDNLIGARQFRFDDLLDHVVVDILLVLLLAENQAVRAGLVVGSGTARRITLNFSDDSIGLPVPEFCSTDSCRRFTKKTTTWFFLVVVIPIGFKPAYCGL
jgi:hypothetical protein